MEPTPTSLQQMIAEGRKSYPNEACGLVFEGPKGLRVEPIENVDRRFIERQRHLIWKIPVDLENHAHWGYPERNKNESQWGEAWEAMTSNGGTKSGALAQADRAAF